MFVRLTNDRSARGSSIDKLGVTNSSSANLGEFTYKSGVVIFSENEPARYVYQIKTGSVRSYKLLSDGRRLIGAFHLPGDVFGLERGFVHRFTAEAIVKTTVCLAKCDSLDMPVDGDAEVARNLLRITSRSLEHAENHMLLLGRKTALERVAAFLAEMDRRLTFAGIMTLPMTREDIADYLGLTLETVSRSLSHLRHLGVLDFIGQTQGREIVIRDRLRLERFDYPT